MSRLSHLSIAIVAAAAFGAAIAQSTPPNPAAANPAQGAGQQSTQATPMGTTGTQADGGAAAPTAGSTMSSSSPATTGSTTTDTTTSTTTTASASTPRAARADRN